MKADDKNTISIKPEYQTAGEIIAVALKKSELLFTDYSKQLQTRQQTSNFADSPEAFYTKEIRK